MKHLLLSFSPRQLFQTLYREAELEFPKNVNVPKITPIKASEVEGVLIALRNDLPICVSVRTLEELVETFYELFLEFVVGINTHKDFMIDMKDDKFRAYVLALMRTVIQFAHHNQTGRLFGLAYTHIGQVMSRDNHRVLIKQFMQEGF